MNRRLDLTEVLLGFDTDTTLHDLRTVLRKTSKVVSEVKTNSSSEPTIKIAYRYVGKRCSKTLKKKLKLLHCQANKCFYCKNELAIISSTLDHYYPKSLGGSNKIENLVLSCIKCNQSKGNKILSEALPSRPQLNKILIEVLKI